MSALRRRLLEHRESAPDHRHSCDPPCVTATPSQRGDQSSTDLSIVDGGSLLLPDGTVFSASVPLVELNANAAGVRTSLRVDQHRLRFWWFTLTAPKAWREASCEFRWEELKEVRRAPHAVVLYSADGRHFRFSARRRKHVDDLVQLFTAHGVPVEDVSTFRLVFRPQ